MPEGSRRRSQLVAVLLLGLLVAWGAALFFGLPWAYQRKVLALVGHPSGTVRRELGKPTQEWSGDAFQCPSGWICPGAQLGGPVLLYATRSSGWLLYFDGVGTLKAAERAEKVD